MKSLRRRFASSTRARPALHQPVSATAGHFLLATFSAPVCIRDAGGASCSQRRGVDVGMAGAPRAARHRRQRSRQDNGGDEKRSSALRAPSRNGAMWPAFKADTNRVAAIPDVTNRVAAIPDVTVLLCDVTSLPDPIPIMAALPLVHQDGAWHLYGVPTTTIRACAPVRQAGLGFLSYRGHMVPLRAMAETRGKVNPLPGGRWHGR